MSQKKPVRKKVVVTTKNVNADSAKKQTPVRAQRTQGKFMTPNNNLLFTKDNYVFMVGGVLLVFLGLALMSGGSMPSPDVWDESIIYSFRRMVLAPVLIVGGLAVEIYAIFKKSPSGSTEAVEN